MVNRIQAVRGMNDVLPGESPLWLRLEDTTRQVLESYGYAQIRVPLLERTELFRGAIGSTTDIVGKEMYTFEDRGGNSLSLRPENTASCVRALIQHGLLQGQSHRLWYIGAMFRRERPQAGRLRQFHQIGAEAFGLEGPDVDAELIFIGERLWRNLKLSGLTLEINSLGVPESRAEYRTSLQQYFRQHVDELDEDSRRRVETNPLRILDSKNPAIRLLVENAPRLDEYLDQPSAAHYAQFKAILDDAGIRYIENPRLVRGLDYYTRTVFEWKTDQLGAQDTICAGGRYDGLVKSQGGPDTPAVGFAMGLERILELLKQRGAEASLSPDIYLLLVGDKASSRGYRLAERWRDALPGLRLTVNAGGGSMKAQMRRADKSGARFALVLADAELEQGVVTLKPLRDANEQRQIKLTQVADELTALLN